MAPTETWFDRFSVRRTRRQALRAAATGAAGAAAASLPFVAAAVPEAKAADNPNDCKKGCSYVANKTYGGEVSSCGFYYGWRGTFSASLDFLFVSPLLVPISNIVYADRMRRCVDRARADWATEAFRCAQPFCPGFDPHAGPYAPCDCSPGDFCNPCAAIESGYICCIYAPGDCHGDCCAVAQGC